MITSKRGRPAGSRNSRGPLAYGQWIAGAATSAAKMNCRSGVEAVSGWWIYVPGEGFVKWRELELQVNEAHRQWRIRKSLEGVRVVDGWEWREDQILEYVVAKSPVMLARKKWLLEWSQRHAEIERRAAA